MTPKQIKVWTWIARVLTLISLLAGVLAATDYLPVWIQRYAALAVALAAAAIGWVRGFLPPTNTKTLPTALLAISATLMLSACPKPYDAAWRSLDTMQKTKELAAQQLSSAAKLKHQECIKAHGEKTPGYADCIKTIREVLKQWQTNLRPAINSAVNITATALQIAERAKQDPKLNWLQLLKPAVCSLLRVGKSWAHYFSDKAASIVSAMSAFEGVTCE